MRNVAIICVVRLDVLKIHISNRVLKLNNIIRVWQQDPNKIVIFLWQHKLNLIDQTIGLNQLTYKKTEGNYVDMIELIS